jgi:uncharacterized protein
MTEPNFERARAYVLDRLQQELPASLTYHNITHTCEDVLPAVDRMAEIEGITGEERLLLVTAALFHDLGFVSHYLDHETTSIELARHALPGFGYRDDQIERVAQVIQATRLPQTPQDRLGEIMADADLDVIGRKDFLACNQRLRLELECLGRPYTDYEWYSSQLAFLESHSYFTPAAQGLRGEQKQRNIEAMRNLLARCSPPEEASTAETAGDADDELSIPERMAILRAVSLFSQTPDEVLAEVASLLSTVELPGGETIFEKGDPGDGMYIIVHGRMRMHDGEMVLNHLGPADVFGEMALLDDEPRVASATAIEDTQLLRLGQQPFYELMAHRVEVARGVIRVLNRRLRGRVHDMAQDFLYIQQVGKITSAAAALEAGVYDPSILDVVCQRTDELGQLARVFQRMANEVKAREQRLKQELQELRIQIDEVKKAQQVAEITESEYFQQLQSKLRTMKQRKNHS